MNHILSAANLLMNTVLHLPPPNIKQHYKLSLILATILGWQVSVFGNTADCESDTFTVTQNYPGANFGSCVATSDSLDIFVVPEDDGPINPSPWYGFKLIPKDTASDLTLQITLNYPTDVNHRYHPKTSTDGKNWVPISTTPSTEEPSNHFEFELTINGTLFVSAQENLVQDWYQAWNLELQNQWSIEPAETIGYSIQNRPIEVFQSNPNAGNYLLLIGRAHPPEIPGVFAMRAFIDRMAEIRLSECSTELSAECRFFARNNVVMVPLLNPDGAINGHWRHNMGSLDLNRDWGIFSQPETAAVQGLVERLNQNSQISLMLDFHSTNRDVFYIQAYDEHLIPENFTQRWFDSVRRQAGNTADEYPAGFEPAERPVSELPTSKNYFYSTYGIPSITFETGDNTERSTIAERVSYFADATVEVFVEEQRKQSSAKELCSYTMVREQPCTDFYCFMIEANKATVHSFLADGRINEQEASRYTQALLEDLRLSDLDTNLRTGNYAVLEPRLIELAGEDISNLHLARSRQDLHGVVRRMIARSHWLKTMKSVQEAHSELLVVAEQHQKTVIPTYTHGVPASPTTFAHVLLAYGASLERLSDRLEEGYTRVNRSPYGAGVGNTSGIKLDRNRLAESLGFDGIVTNSFDSNFVSTVDFKLEFASILSNAALVVNQFVQNTHDQQRDPWPWMWIVPLDEVDSRSTSMPQKKNPRDLDRLRTAANDVLSAAQRMIFNSHNVSAGMHDYRMASNVEQLATSASIMLDRFEKLISQLVVDPDRALDEVNRSFATSAQIAEILFSEANVTFRRAHEFSAKLVELGRSTERTFAEISDDEVASLYHTTLGEALPVAMELIREALDARNVVLSREGIGGPQVEETTKMLQSQRMALTDSQHWFQQKLVSINLADIALQDSTKAMCVQD